MLWGRFEFEKILSKEFGSASIRAKQKLSPAVKRLLYPSCGHSDKLWLMSNPNLPANYTQFFVENDRLGALVGAKFVSLNSDECVYEYEVSKEHFNPNGILHGGALYTVMDTSQGMFLHFILDEIYQAGATGTATVKYLAPLRSGKITIRTKLTSREGRKYFIRSEATDASGAVVATLDEVCIAIPKK